MPTAHQSIDDWFKQYYRAHKAYASTTLTSAPADECVHHGISVILFNRCAQGANVSAVCDAKVAGGCPSLCCNLIRLFGALTSVQYPNLHQNTRGG